MIIRYHYKPCPEASRPKILALTATPVDRRASEPDEAEFLRELEGLERQMCAFQRGQIC